MPQPSAARRRGGGRDDKPGKEILAPAISLRHKQSRREKTIGTGFAWDLFLFAGILGLPLFPRRLSQWGSLILALWLVDLVLGRLPLGAGVFAVAQTLLFACFLAVQLWLGFYGNKLTVQALIAHGWAVERAEDHATRRVLKRWGIAVSSRASALQD